jgi:uncharacterized protein YvpB
MERDDRVSQLLRQAEAATRRHRDAEARRLLRAVLRDDPSNEKALLWMVYLAEDGPGSLVYLAHLMEAHPNHPQVQSALRWARRRAPNAAGNARILTTWRTPVVPRRRGLLPYGLLLVAVVIGLGLFWQAVRPLQPSVQASAGSGFQDAAVPSATPRTLMDIVRISIPLFTLTPPPTATVPPPTPTPSSAWAPVIGRPQTFNMSCESRSAADLAAFWGVPVSEAEILTALGTSDNPHEGFVGDVGAAPGSLPPYGYGVYAEPIAWALRAAGLDARPVYDLGLAGLQGELLAGRPVLIWATYAMEIQEPVEWTSSDGRVSTVVPYMHTFIVTGYDEEGLSVVDAYDGTLQRYSFDDVVRVWNLFDQMAVLVNGPLS